MRKFALLSATTALISAGLGGTAHASPDFDTFNANDAVWGCAGDPGVMLPPNHCINLKSQGDTGIIHVFAPDPRWPSEGISSNPRSDTRPCPHDPDAVDGTWWSPLPGVWVCHHRPS